jgi:hypothetical protein
VLAAGPGRRPTRRPLTGRKTPSRVDKTGGSAAHTDNGLTLFPPAAPRDTATVTASRLALRALLLTVNAQALAWCESSTPFGDLSRIGRTARRG